MSSTDYSLVVHYAAVGYRPYREIGEYVNVGIVAVEPNSRFLAYRLMPLQRTKRISACFPAVDLSIYRQHLKQLEKHLATLAVETNSVYAQSGGAGHHPAQQDLFLQGNEDDFFQRLVHDEESCLFFAKRGVTLANDLPTCVHELYRRYVEHWDLTPIDYAEKELNRSVRRLLQTKRLDRFYREAPSVGTDAYHIGIPLAFWPEGSDLPTKVIKPLNLAQATPTRIYTYGDEWVSKLTRLKRVKSLPEQFLFAVRMPSEPDCQKAANEIRRALEKKGVQVVDIEDQDAILKFSALAQEPDLKLEAE